MFQHFKSIHFIGVCGTVMASVAVALKNCGISVTGSDQKVYPPMSNFLIEQGVEVSEGYRKANLDKSPDLVVIGNAISRGNPEAEAVLERKLRYCSLPELVNKLFIQGKRSLVITGTHGKTTTASLLAWILDCNGFNPSYLIGGIPENFSQGARFTDSEWIVLEGDEYDTAFFDKRSKFLHYLPEVVLINNLEFDHSDIFNDLQQIQTSFKRLVNLVPSNGLLLVNGDDENITPLIDIDHCSIESFTLSHLDDLEYRQTGASFILDGFCFELPLYGEFNVRNALGVIYIARYCGLSNEQIQRGFDSFKGIKRRMEVKAEIRGITVVDDFAHHPTAIRETLKAARVRFPGKRIWAVFEPRSNTTRRNIFQNELAESLGHADVIVISGVTSAGGIPQSDLLDTQKLAETLKNAKRLASCFSSVDQILDHIINHVEEGDAVCILSNGGFGSLHERLARALKG
tara:strand:- start:3614 stop:4990 length:1377 start_codon:yes stop_codon:yes gene_type:complete